MLDTPARAIELLGGNTAVADRLKKKMTTVASWGARGSIPIEEWPKLIAFAQEKSIKGFSYEALALAHVGQNSKRPRRKAA